METIGLGGQAEVEFAGCLGPCLSVKEPGLPEALEFRGLGFQGYIKGLGV